MDRAMIESGVRALINMAVGMGIVKLSMEDQAALAVFLGAVLWTASVWWSKQSDKAVAAKGG